MRILIMSLCLGLWSSAHAALTVSNSYVNFYDTPVNGFEKSETIYVQNLSPQTVQIQTGTSCYGDFNLTNFCTLSLGPNQSCQISIHFQPRREGQQSCYINLNDFQGGSAFVNVSGRGVNQN